MKSITFAMATLVGIACLLQGAPAAAQNDCYLNATQDIFVVVFETREGDVKGEVVKKAWVKAGERFYHQSPNPVLFIGYTTEAYDDEVNRMANLNQVQLTCSGGEEIDIP
jgi:hypothetical protein